MIFINRKEERVSFKKNYEENAQDNVSQVYSNINSLPSTS